jgi:hypothetical protein
MRHLVTASAQILLLALPAAAQDNAPAPNAPTELEQSGLTPPPWSPRAMPPMTRTFW